MRFLAALLIAFVPAAPAPSGAPAFNGTVHAIAYRGDTVYVGGAFTTATWAGRSYPRQRLAAFDARTGKLLNWAPAADATVRALVATGDGVYAAGDFHAISGRRRDALARLSPISGTVDPFAHEVSGTPYALAAGHGRLYLGGSFTTVDRVKRRNLAAFDLDTGRLDERWRPTADDRVRTLAVSGGEVFLGGAFHRVNGVRNTLRLAAVSGTAGTLDRYFRPAVAAEVNALTVDSGGVYAAAGGRGGRAVAFAPDGSMRWQRVFDGDAVAITRRHGVTYVGGHFDRACLTPRNGPKGACLDGSEPRVKLAAVTEKGHLAGWAPQANGVIGVRVLGSGTKAGSIDAGGDFTTVGGSTHARFARFIFETPGRISGTPAPAPITGTPVPVTGTGGPPAR